MTSQRNKALHHLRRSYGRLPANFSEAFISRIEKKLARWRLLNMPLGLNDRSLDEDIPKEATHG